MGKRKAKKILSACLALTFLLTVRAEGRTIALPESDRDTMETAQSSPDVADETVTLMVYMVGSTLESQTYGAAEGAASRDIREIIASGVDTSRVNVLVFTGGASRWTSNVSGEHNSVYLLEEAGLHDIYDTDYNWDMGEADTLAEFLRYGYNEFPADHYALILWDHGGGPLGGFGLDENYVNEYGEADRLYPEELREALERSPFGGSVRFDWVGYDACLMDSIETAVLWADYADYLIASEESESGDGWDYSFLSVLNETVDPARIGTAAADSFADFYEKNKTWYFNPDYTLSCLDLSKVSDVTDCLDALFAEMARDVSGSVDSYKDFAEIRNKATCFSPDERCDLVDLGDLAARTAALYPELAGDLSDSVAELVVCNRANMEGAGGVSIYYPYDNKELYESYADYYATLGMPYGYLEYLTPFPIIGRRRERISRWRRTRRNFPMKTRWSSS